MDITVLPKHIEYSSPSQLKFIRSATLKDICERYSTYFGHRNNSSMKSSISSTKMILDELEKLGYLSSYIDPKTAWVNFIVTPAGSIKSLNDSYSKTGEPVLFAHPDPKEAVHILDINTDIINSEKAKNQPDLVEKFILYQKYTSLMKSAIQRGIKFTLTVEEVEELLSEEYCYFTGVKFSVGDYVLSVDRLDNKKGYETGNVVACTKISNSLKSDLFESTTGLFPTIDDLKAFVDKMYYGIHPELDPLNILLVK